MVVVSIIINFGEVYQILQTRSSFMGHEPLKVLVNGIQTLLLLYYLHLYDVFLLVKPLKVLPFKVKSTIYIIKHSALIFMSVLKYGAFTVNRFCHMLVRVLTC